MLIQAAANGLVASDLFPASIPGVNDLKAEKILAQTLLFHADQWDSVKIDGTLESRDCAITYSRGDLRLAVATISRDRENLQAELAFERPQDN